jgi:superfamily II DNA or RNA helicase
VRVVQADRDTGPADATVVIASVQTVAAPRWAERLPPADLVIIDECHHAAAPTWAALAARYADARLLGLTATPQRGDGAPLGDVFDDLVVGASIRELTEAGHLVPCRVYVPAGGEVSGRRLACSPLEAYRRHAGGQRAVVFCGTVEHASEVAERFRADGVPTGTVTGSTPDDVRARTLAEFRVGELRVLTNVHVLTEGWDDPGCAVAILARSCDAASTYLQAVGRVLRPAPGKDHAVLVDLAGVVEKHGLPDADRIYALTGRAISSGGQSLRQCAVCGAVFTSATCPEGCVSAVPPRVIVEQRLDTVAAPTRTFATEYELALVAKLSGYCQVCRSGYGPGTQIMYRRGRRFHPHRACWRPGWEAAV